jgi:hypothetical protein
MESIIAISTFCFHSLLLRHLLSEQDSIYPLAQLCKGFLWEFSLEDIFLVNDDQHILNLGRKTMVVVML